MAKNKKGVASEPHGAARMDAIVLEPEHPVRARPPLTVLCLS